MGDVPCVPCPVRGVHRAVGAVGWQCCELRCDVCRSAVRLICTTQVARSQGPSATCAMGIVGVCVCVCVCVFTVVLRMVPQVCCSVVAPHALFCLSDFPPLLSYLSFLPFFQSRILSPLPPPPPPPPHPNGTVDEVLREERVEGMEQGGAGGAGGTGMGAGRGTVNGGNQFVGRAVVSPDDVDPSSIGDPPTLAGAGSGAGAGREGEDGTSRVSVMVEPIRFKYQYQSIFQTCTPHAISKVRVAWLRSIYELPVYI